jgi:PKD domain
MRKDFWPKGIAISIALLLVILIIIVFTPSFSAVKLTPGTPDKASLPIHTTIVFTDINLTIRSQEAIPVNYLVFQIFRNDNNEMIAQVNFSILGTEISDNPIDAFTVEKATVTSNIPFQTGGNHYGKDEETGVNITGFNYGYGASATDLSILYTITYTTHQTGTFYAKLFINSTTHTYASGESTPFTVEESTNGGLVADAAGPYNGLTYQTIQFDGSHSHSSNASIVNYTWVFGDGTYGYGVAPTHAYSDARTSIVILTVTDSNNLQANATTTVTILLDANRNNISDIMDETIGADITLSDINPISINDQPYYLVDTNADGIYDTLYNPTTNTKAILGQQNGKQLIDINGDGQWDYLYDPALNYTTPYTYEKTTSLFGSLLLIGLISIIIMSMIFLVVMLYRDGYI